MTLLRKSLCAIFLTTMAVASAQAQDGAPPPKVSVAAAYTEEITQETVFIGRSEAVAKVDLVARVDGYLQDIVVEDGAVVTQDELLFNIEPDQYQATLDARNADLAKAEADLTLTQIELDRKRQLVEREAVPQSELDVARANEAVAEAAILSAKAGIREAELNLSYTKISAPFDGVIGKVAVSVGALVNSSTGPLVTLVQTSPMFVTFSISENQLADIQQEAIANGGSLSAPPDLDVHVTLPNGSELDETGKLDFGDNQIDPATGTLAIRAIFENAEGLLIDGGFVNVSIEAAEPVQETLIPQAAVQQDQRGPFVLVVNDQQIVEQRYITTGDTEGTAIIVSDGLVPGESVIVEGLQRVRPGAPVEAVTAGTSQEG
ncbi:MAG: efflux RND transporter periplasmic adaptor subunit [Pseudomonadota bacterium]